MWLRAEEIAKRLGVSAKTVKRRAKKGEWPWRYEANPAGREYILIDFSLDTSVQSPPKKFAEDRTVWTDRTNGLDTPVQSHYKQNSGLDSLDTLITSPVPTAGPLLPASEDQTEAAPPAASAPLDLNPDPEPDVPDTYLRIGQLRAQLCAYTEGMFKSMKKSEAYKMVSILYNRGEIIQELRSHKADATISPRTIQRWMQVYSLTHDFYDLVPKYNVGGGAISVTPDEERFLLRHYLSPNQPKIGTIIKMLKIQAQRGDVQSPSSPATLRRWVQKYENENRLVCDLMRKGEKHLKDNVIKHIERDANLLEVGDVWIADGNTLNFQILNPITGKPARMIFVPWMDWRSRCIVGGCIAPTEDVMNIANAFRNAALNWGGVPRAILIDNGRAFRAGYFRRKNNDANLPDIENEMAGLYTRLGIEEHYAKPYNGRAKPIERWFKTFNDNFERFLDNYRGSSIDKKPANLARNEKFLQKFATEEPLELEEAQRLISYYVSEYYHKMPHASLDGKTPMQVFSAFSIPEERRITAPQLNYLMLRGAEKTIKTQGIRHLHLNYWHPKLSYMVGHKVIFRWDPNDMRTVLVYDTNGKYICQATANKKLHPMISLDPNRELSQKQLERELAHQARILKNTKKQAIATLSDAAQIDRKLINSLPAEDAPLFHSNRKQLPDDNEDIDTDLKTLGL